MPTVITRVAAEPVPMVMSDAVAVPSASAMCPVVVAIRPPALMVIAAEVRVATAVLSRRDRVAAALSLVEPEPLPVVLVAA